MIPLSINGLNHKKSITQLQMTSYCFFFFCFLFATQMIHMNSQALFSLYQKNKIATILQGTLRVKKDLMDKTNCSCVVVVF